MGNSNDANELQRQTSPRNDEGATTQKQGHAMAEEKESSSENVKFVNRIAFCRHHLVRNSPNQDSNGGAGPSASTTSERRPPSEKVLRYFSAPDDVASKTAESEQDRDGGAQEEVLPSLPSEELTTRGSNLARPTSEAPLDESFQAQEKENAENQAKTEGIPEVGVDLQRSPRPALQFYLKSPKTEKPTVKEPEPENESDENFSIDAEPYPKYPQQNVSRLGKDSGESETEVVPTQTAPEMKLFRPEEESVETEDGDTWLENKSQKEDEPEAKSLPDTWTLRPNRYYSTETAVNGEENETEEIFSGAQIDSTPKQALDNDIDLGEQADDDDYQTAFATFEDGYDYEGTAAEESASIYSGNIDEIQLSVNNEVVLISDGEVSPFQSNNVQYLANEEKANDAIEICRTAPLNLFASHGKGKAKMRKVQENKIKINARSKVEEHIQRKNRSPTKNGSHVKKRRLDSDSEEQTFDFDSPDIHRDDSSVSNVQDSENIGKDLKTESASHIANPTVGTHEGVDRLSGLAKAQLAVGSSFGLVGGVMDNRYTEPFGLILGASLLILQLLDHEEMLSLYWNKNKRHLHTHRLKENEGQLPTVSEEIKLFFSENFYIGAGFAGGYFAGHVMSDLARDLLEDRSKT